MPSGTGPSGETTPEAIVASSVVLAVGAVVAVLVWQLLQIACGRQGRDD